MVRSISMSQPLFTMKNKKELKKFLKKEVEIFYLIAMTGYGEGNVGSAARNP